MATYSYLDVPYASSPAERPLVILSVSGKYLTIDGLEGDADEAIRFYGTEAQKKAKAFAEKYEYHIIASGS